MTTYQILSTNVCKKASAQNRAKALKIMRFLGLVASQVLPISFVRKHGFEKSFAKAMQKQLLSKKSAGFAKAHKYRVFRHN